MTKTLQVRVFETLFAAILLLGTSSIFNFDYLHAAQKADVQVETQSLKTVNINTANPQELQSLRGVGPAIAERIMQYRKEHGRFEKIEDLTNVHGIGEAKFQKLKNQISI